MAKNKFLVIGCHSFSGSNFVKELLLSDYKVLGVSRSDDTKKIFLPFLWESNIKKFPNGLKNYNFEKIDLNTDLTKLISIIEKYKPEYIINLAAQGMVSESWLSPLDWYQTNVISQVALHDELRKMKFIKKYLHVTTPEVYGSTDSGWIRENFHFAPTTPYAVSRASCDLHLMSFYKAYNFPVIFSRAANVYGPGQQLYRIIPRTMLSVLTGKSMELHGGGISERAFIHISDVAKASIKITLDAKPGTSWHISCDQKISIRDLVEKIFNFGNKEDFRKVVKIAKERLGKDQSYLLDSSKIRFNFNWNDEVSLDKGLQDTFIWIKNNLSIMKTLPWNYQHKT